MAERTLVVDSDVMIDFLRGWPAAAGLVRRAVDRLAVSAITVAELYAGIKGEQEQAALDDLLGVLRVVPVSDEVARAGGLIRREFGPSHGVGLADAVIAATVIHEQADFATLNVKHYPMIPHLKPAYRRH